MVERWGKVQIVWNLNIDENNYIISHILHTKYDFIAIFVETGTLKLLKL